MDKVYIHFYMIYFVTSLLLWLLLLLGAEDVVWPELLYYNSILKSKCIWRREEEVMPRVGCDVCVELGCRHACGMLNTLPSPLLSAASGHLVNELANATTPEMLLCARKLTTKALNLTYCIFFSLCSFLRTSRLWYVTGIIQHENIYAMRSIMKILYSWGFLEASAVLSAMNCVCLYCQTMSSDVSYMYIHERALSEAKRRKTHFIL